MNKNKVALLLLCKHVGNKQKLVFLSYMYILLQICKAQINITLKYYNTFQNSIKNI